MRNQVKKLIALISTSLAYTQPSVAMQNADEIKSTSTDVNQLKASVLNTKVSVELAAHRSHSSHSSHRSSSSGGYRSSSPSTYSTPKPKSAPIYTKPKTTKKSDPVGQDKRPKGSYPTEAVKKDLETKLKNKKMKENITKRMQLTLQIEGYYKGPIDGVMSKKLQDAAYAFKKAKGISGYAIYDAETLNAMGIIGY